MNPTWKRNCPSLSLMTRRSTTEHLTPNLLTNWRWVSKQTIQCTKDGTFGPTRLDELQRHQTLRTPQETARDLPSFLSAWTVYMSIHTKFAPERAPGLAMFTERVIQFTQEQEVISAVAEYALSYLNRYQNIAPPQWFNQCDDLYNQFIWLARPDHPSSPAPIFSLPSISASSEPRAASILPHNAPDPSSPRRGFEGTIAPLQ
jgi:hypothetical protein